MGRIKQLAGQTAIYGASSILGRIFNYLLVPLWTRIFIPSEFGTITEMYAYVSFLVVILTYGMETAFFRYSNTLLKTGSNEQRTANNDNVYSTTLISLIVSSVLFVLVIALFSQHIANTLRYPDHREYILWFAMIVSLDALSSIPFAKLRALNKAMRFASVKLIFIGVNIGLNIFFLILCPYIYKHHTPVLFDFISLFFNGKVSVGYVFIANLIASIGTVLLLSPEIINIKYRFDKILWKKMLVYALPLLIAGLTGIVNETGDRVMLKWLLPRDISMTQLGIYGACYKISILLTLFIGAYRYAAEPFFFSYEKETDSRKIYATVMNYFVIIVTTIFLAIMLYIDLVMLFVGEKFRVGAPVVPILLLANLCLGVYYNLSIWYKLTNKTGYGALMSIAGAVITLALNFYWIPRIGYMGSAWATLICYASMMILSYIVGQRFYHIQYNLRRISLYIGLALFLYFISYLLHTYVLILNSQFSILNLVLSTFLLLIFFTVILFSEKPGFLFKTQNK